ncbi:MAG: nucleotidyltransferase domain-containing protein [Clostridium sp.]|uniref:nucleotidyltransferase domain-containing protein n=1 Tax=Clostridium sp. TaxID=1506 RepID=UPI003F357911
MIKSDVNYTLDDEVREEIKRVKEVIMKVVKKSKVYLFGSIAKGRYSKDSDIDVLVLINEGLEIKSLRKLRNDIEDKIEEESIKRAVDIKLYEETRFSELSKKVSFEKDIIKDLIDIGEW